MVGTLCLLGVCAAGGAPALAVWVEYSSFTVYGRASGVCNKVLKICPLFCCYSALSHEPLQETYVFQVKKDEQGRLDLTDITILDRNTGEKRKAYALSELPDEPMHFYDLPWQTEFLGNILKDQPSKIWVWAYYLIAQRGADRRQGLDLDCVYRLDGQEGTVERCSVLRVAPPETPENQLLLRIKQYVVAVK